MLNGIAGTLPLIYLLLRGSFKRKSQMVTMGDYLRCAFARRGTSLVPEKLYFKELYTANLPGQWLLWPLRATIMIGTVSAAFLFAVLIVHSARPSLFHFSHGDYEAMAAISGVAYGAVYAVLGYTWHHRFGAFLGASHKKAALTHFFGNLEAAKKWAANHGPMEGINPLLFLQQELAWLNLMKSISPWLVTLTIAVLYGTSCADTDNELARGIIGVIGLLSILPASLPALSQLLPWNGDGPKLLRFQRQVALSDIREVLE
ncbi:hypothetical protein [Acidithiobacillus ferrooxidans]|uniref:hypothetical protein n=1 Tax=Acidithiobacillus ferrooxidans TaxID=920 RepID=UPI000A72D3C8|nr:hypothetical protein [Acidithiobacillus ferrooxidans]